MLGVCIAFKVKSMSGTICESFKRHAGERQSTHNWLLYYCFLPTLSIRFRIFCTRFFSCFMCTTNTCTKERLYSVRTHIHIKFFCFSPPFHNDRLLDSPLLPLFSTSNIFCFLGECRCNAKFAQQTKKNMNFSICFFPSCFWPLLLCDCCTQFLCRFGMFGNYTCILIYKHIREP